MEPTAAKDPARILIVDDHPTFAKGLRALLLAEAGEEEQVIEIASNALEGMVAAQSFAPHLILMDIGLPGRSGIEATSDIKAVAPSTVIVMLTASDDEEDLVAALKAGASGYLLKTMDLGEIAGAVESIIQGNLVIPAHLAGKIMSTLETASPELRVRLTAVETQVLSLIAKGHPNGRIAQKLKISQEDVGKIIAGIYSKLHVTTRAQAIAEGVRRGLVR